MILETDPQLAGSFRQAMRRVASTVNVITICVDGQPMGITATALEAGIGVITMAEVKRLGIVSVLEAALARLSHCPAIMVDFDIDVIDRAQCPGAPGARPGGMPADMFFQAARFLGAERKVKLVDLTEFDPSLDVANITALTAGRWVAEILAGFSAR